MSNGKKWLAVLTEEHYEWLKSVIEKTDLKGSDIVNEMFDRIMEDDKKFVASLTQAQLKIRLQKINDKKMAIADEEREIRKQYSEKVAA